MRLVGEASELPVTRRKQHVADGATLVVGGDVAVMVRIDGFSPDGRNEMVEVVSSGWTSDERKRYLEAIGASQCGDPAIRRLWKSTGLRTFLRRELISDRDWYGSRWTREAHLPAFLDDGAYSVRPLEQSSMTEGIGVHRAPKAKPFTAEDCALVHLLNAECARLFRALASPFTQALRRLSPRQKQTLEHLCAGMSEKEIAQALAISRSTVHTYVKALYSVLGVSSRAELLVRALAAS